MLPLSLLKTAVGHPVLVELKNGETYNGSLVSCDMYMNINLAKVICTSRDGDKFWRLPACYVRGSTIKYMCIPDEVIDMVPEEEEQPKPQSASVPAPAASSFAGGLPPQQVPKPQGAWASKRGGSQQGTAPQQQQQQRNSQPSQQQRGGSGSSRGGNARGGRGGGSRGRGQSRP